MDIKIQTESAIAFTKKVTDLWESRLTGSPECLACADLLKEEFASFSDSVHTQDFTTYPKSFLGFIKINVIGYFAALVLCYLGYFDWATAVVLVCIGITVFQFLFYYELIDTFFKKRTSRNVWGIIEPEGEVKQQVFVTAHHDSAFVFNMLQYFPKYYGAVIVGGLGIFVVFGVFLTFLSIFNVFGLNFFIAPNTLFWIFASLSIAVLPLWFFVSNKGTPGAGDNMACTASAIEIGKHFNQLKKSGSPLKNTRVIIASWDAEEVGLRGARAFLKTHSAYCQNVKTYNFNMECFYNKNSLFMLTSDLNSFVPLSEKMASDCAKIGKNLGFDVSLQKFPVLAGGTDAAEFAKKGIEATTLCGMNFDLKDGLPAYHTLRDTVDAVDPEVVGAAILIGIGFVDSLESKPIS